MLTRTNPNVYLPESDYKNMEEEFQKCRESFDYYCQKYVITKPFKEQLEFADLITNKKYVIALKDRQCGASTLIQAYLSWLLAFHKGVVIGVICKDSYEAKHFKEQVSKMINKLPYEWRTILRTCFYKDNSFSFILGNNNELYSSFIRGNSRVLLGKAITFLVIDEVDFCKNIENAYNDLAPIMAITQKQCKEKGYPYGIVMYSTLKGEPSKRFFYNRYMRASLGDNQFIPHRMRYHS